MRAVFKREFKSYFTSPVGYIFYALFMIFYGIFFYLSIMGGETTSYNSSGLSNFFGMIYFVLLILIPVLTMRLFSEERKQKTDQLLITSPVSLTGITLGKFFSAFLIYFIAVASTIFFALVIAANGRLDIIEYFGMLVGLTFLGAAIIAVGEFISALTTSQVAAAFLTFGAIILTFVPTLLQTVVPTGFFRSLLEFISLHTRYTDFTSGLFDLSNILFYVSFSGIFIFLTIRKLEARRWS